MTHPARVFLIAFIYLVAVPVSVCAQVMVSTGRIVQAAPSRGVLSIRTDQGYVLSYSGIRPSQIQFSTGEPATIRELQSSRPVTIEYTLSGGEWVVARVLVEPGAEYDGLWGEPESPLTVSERWALRSPAAQDVDITTQPGGNARLDFDITTQPGRAEERSDFDITRRPASTDPDFDGDITTHR